VNALRIVIGDDVATPDFTRDSAGHIVDLRPSKWRLNAVESTNTIINWDRLQDCDEDAIFATRLHILRLIETHRARHAYNTENG